MKKILIIEDDEAIRSELQKLLTNSGYEAQITDTFSNVKEQIEKIKPDLILLDINLPELNGEVILKEIRKESDIPVVMVTSRTSEVDEVLSMSYGADDFITKPYNPTVLLLRIQNIFKRMIRTGERQMYNGLEVNFSKSTISDGQTEIRLTKNEMIVFSFLLTNRGKIVTRDDLMTDLWNNDEYINDNALTVNISRLRNKLAEIGYEGAIETRKGQGYILL
ncbi:response regulator transcription factor [uncultured Eubacterium sp.]|uniref:response regulator transcription factor n=1 Tax=uncultured Eubacterium sp. TaxID=165185 RepID=UPI002673D76D|nr:response regulator transcription factor [uncultured Eubacterium sp.]